MSHRKLPVAAAVLLAAVFFGWPTMLSADSPLAPAAEKPGPADAWPIRNGSSLRRRSASLELPRGFRRPQRRERAAQALRGCDDAQESPGSVSAAVVGLRHRYLENPQGLRRQGARGRADGVNFEIDDAKGKAALKRAHAGGYRPHPVDGFGIDRLAVDATTKDGKLPGRHRVLEGPVVLRQTPRLQPGIGHQFRLHVAEHAHRRPDGVCQRAQAEAAKHRRSGRLQQHQRHRNAGQAGCRLCPIARHPRARDRRAGS